MSVTASPAKCLQQYLVDTGVVTAPSEDEAWPAFVASEQDEPDNLVTVYDTGSNYQGRHQGAGDRVTKPTCQIRIRGATYPVAWAKGLEIQAELDKVGIPSGRGGVGQPMVSVSGGTVRFQNCQIYTTLTFIGQQEQNQRQVFTINVQLSLSEV